MPNLDKTGPLGQGEGTGRGLGSRGGGYGQCCRMGGYGFRRFISPKNELVALEEYEKILEEELVAVREEKKFFKDRQK
ncbi:DUF5320 family protein [Patescibacteria group bacterium]|nr:DUF5320 family protein [Patescibacteria group bacterium]MCG2695280.1 hypothetical protein [Candidatus Parcubacteria bacterium]